jgi:hypothetical protein
MRSYINIAGYDRDQSCVSVQSDQPIFCQQHWKPLLAKSRVLAKGGGDERTTSLVYSISATLLFISVCLGGIPWKEINLHLVGLTVTRLEISKALYIQSREVGDVE